MINFDNFNFAHVLIEIKFWKKIFLEDETKKEFFFLSNTHLDSEGEGVIKKFYFQYNRENTITFDNSQLLKIHRSFFLFTS